MRTNLLTLMVLLIASTGLFAQKVDIDKTRCKVQTANYPKYNVHKDDKTYALEYSGTTSFSDVLSDIKIKGFQQVDENPNFIFKVHVNGFSSTKAETKNRKQVKKDKEGNVTSSKTYYYVTYGNRGRADFKVITEPYDAFVYKTPKQRKKEEERAKKKAKKKREKESKKKKKEKEKKDSNPFLKNVDTDVPDEEEEVADTDTREALVTKNLELLKNHKTNESTSAKTAYGYYKNERVKQRESDRQSFRSYIKSGVKSSVDKSFNYTKRTVRASLRTMDSKKHRENETFRQAVDALKVILGKIRYNRVNDQVEADLQPIIEYFNATAEKYSPSDKQERKIRAAALYNLGKIYLYLEKPTELKQVANLLIKDKYKDGDGKSFLEDADLIEKRHEFFDLSNRYIDADAEEEEEESEEVEEEDDEGNR